MNAKANSFKEYLAKNNINYFKIEDESAGGGQAESGAVSAADKTVFHTYVKVFGQNLPAAVSFDDSIYTLIRLQVIPDTTYLKNSNEFMKCVNEMNITYKAVKYYLGADNALYLEMYAAGLSGSETDGALLINMLNAVRVHLEKEYPNWMKLLWL